MDIRIGPESLRLVPPAGAAKPPAGASAGGRSFGTVLEEAIAEVDALQKQAEQAALRLASGADIDLHQVSIAGARADLALQLTIAIRNKLVEAYQEIMRMQV